MREKFLCFIHSSYLCSRRQKMQSNMKKKIYIIIAFCTFLTTEASAQQQVSFGPLHSPDSPREEWLLPGDTVYQAGKPMINQGKPMKNAYMTPARLSDKKETLGKNGLMLACNWISLIICLIFFWLMRIKMYMLIHLLM